MQALAEILTVNPLKGTDRPRGGYTMVGNYLLDKVIPGIQNRVAKLILVKVERETVGYHREVAAVSLQVMMDFTGASKSTVKRARRELIKLGYLVVVEEGTGHTTTKYRLELHPGQDISPDAHVRDPSPASSRDTLNILSVVPETSDVCEPGTWEEPSPDKMSEHQPEAIPGETQRHQDIPATEDSGMNMTTQGVQGDPPFKGLNKEKEKKTNKETEAVPQLDQPQGPNEAVQAVCSTLRSFGVSVERSDYAFIQWCCREHEEEKIVHKLDILRRQLLRGVSFSNPLGWLRCALAGDYQYSTTDITKVKAEELAEQGRERSQQKRAERQKHYDEVRTERNDPKAQARIKAYQDEFLKRYGGQDE